MIASTFFRAGMIESWGRGIENLTTACKDAGLREPLIDFKYNHEFSVTFFYDAAIVENIVDGIVENIALTAVQSQILEMMSGNPRITTKALAEEIGIAPRNVQVHIKSLREMGLIERIGSAKGGRWEVIK